MYLKYTATDSVIHGNCKNADVHLHLLLSSSNSVRTTYCKTGVSNHSNSFTNIIYTGGIYMILD